MKPLLSYRRRQQLQRGSVLLLCLLLVLLLAAVGIVIYLGRYLVFTDEEAYFSFLRTESAEEAPTLSVSGSDFPGVEIGESIARPDYEAQTPVIDEVPPDAIRGVCLSYSDLADPEGCLAAVRAVEDCNTVLLQLKSSAGNFYYNTRFSSSHSSTVDPAAVDELIQQLDALGYHLIARISALPDSNWALQHLDCGLQLSSGALWMDEDGYYWLDPAKEDVQDYLCTLALELYQLGIDEIALSGFYYPESENIAYSTDEIGRYMDLSAAAGKLMDLAAEYRFAVSFIDPPENSPSPSSDGHILLSNVEGSQAALNEERYQSLLSGSETLIFLTDSRDTRFEPYGILRSIELE